MIFSNTIEDWRISYLWKWYTYLSNSWILFCQSLLIDKQLVRFDNHAFKIVYQWRITSWFDVPNLVYISFISKLNSYSNNSVIISMAMSPLEYMNSRELYIRYKDFE